MNVASRLPNDPSTIHIQYCRSCDTHNWCTHHDEAKYHQHFLKFSEEINKRFPNLEIIGNMIPPNLIPFKISENKYIDSSTNKYVVYPQIGSFQIYFHGEVIFSKKQSNTWPNINLICNKIQSLLNPSSYSAQKTAIKKDKQIPPKPKQRLSEDQKTIKSKQKSKQSSNQFFEESSQNNNYYKNQTKGFTLTDHFKMYRQKEKAEEKDWLTEKNDSETNILFYNRQSNEDDDNSSSVSKKRQQYTGETKLRDMLNNKRKQGKKEMIINLDSIQEQAMNGQQGLGQTQRGEQVIKHKNIKLQQFDNQLSSLQSKFKKFEHRVLKIRNQQFESKQEQQSNNESNKGYESSKKFIKTFQSTKQLIRGLDGSKKQQDKWKKQSLMGSQKIQKLQQYINASQEEKNMKLHKIYGEWKLIKRNDKKIKKRLPQQRQRQQRQQTQELQSQEDASVVEGSSINQSNSTAAQIFTFKPKQPKAQKYTVEHDKNIQNSSMQKYSSYKAIPNNKIVQQGKRSTQQGFYGNGLKNQQKKTNKKTRENDYVAVNKHQLANSNQQIQQFSHQAKNKINIIHNRISNIQNQLIKNKQNAKKQLNYTETTLEDYKGEKYHQKNQQSIAQQTFHRYSNFSQEYRPINASNKKNSELTSFGNKKLKEIQVYQSQANWSNKKEIKPKLLRRSNDKGEGENKRSPLNQRQTRQQSTSHIPKIKNVSSQNQYLSPPLPQFQTLSAKKANKNSSVRHFPPNHHKSVAKMNKNRTQIQQSKVNLQQQREYSSNNKNQEFIRYSHKARSPLSNSKKQKIWKQSSPTKNILLANRINHQEGQENGSTNRALQSHETAVRSHKIKNFHPQQNATTPKKLIKINKNKIKKGKDGDFKFEPGSIKFGQIKKNKAKNEHANEQVLLQNDYDEEYNRQFSQEQQQFKDDIEQVSNQIKQDVSQGSYQIKDEISQQDNNQNMIDIQISGQNYLNKSSKLQQQQEGLYEMQQPILTDQIIKNNQSQQECTEQKLQFEQKYQNNGLIQQTQVEPNNENQITKIQNITQQRLNQNPKTSQINNPLQNNKLMPNSANLNKKLQQNIQTQQNNDQVKQNQHKQQINSIKLQKQQQKLENMSSCSPLNGKQSNNNVQSIVNNVQLINNDRLQNKINNNNNNDRLSKLSSFRSQYPLQDLDQITNKYDENYKEMNIEGQILADNKQQNIVQYHPSIYESCSDVEMNCVYQFGQYLMQKIARRMLQEQKIVQTNKQTNNQISHQNDNDSNLNPNKTNQKPNDLIENNQFQIDSQNKTQNLNFMNFQMQINQNKNHKKSTIIKEQNKQRLQKDDKQIDESQIKQNNGQNIISKTQLHNLHPKNIKQLPSTHPQEDNVYTQSKYNSRFIEIGIQKQLTLQVSIQTDTFDNHLYSHHQFNNNFITKDQDQTVQSLLSKQKEVHTIDRLKDNFFKQNRGNNKKNLKKRQVERAHIISKMYGQNNQQQFVKFQKVVQGRQSFIYKEEGSILEIQNIYPNGHLFSQKGLQTSSITSKFKKLLKVFEILSDKNEWLITRLFEDPHSVLNNFCYGVWLCKNFKWECFLVDNNLKVDQDGFPLYTHHESQLFWPNIIQKAIGIALGGYQNLEKADCSQLFNLLTGCNSLNIPVKQDPRKNAKLLQLVQECQKKNYIIHAEKNVNKLKADQAKQSTYYILSIRKGNQQEQPLVQLSQDGKDSVWMKFCKFTQQFNKIQILQLRINHNFSYADMGVRNQGHLTVVELLFEQEGQGCITISYIQKSGSLRAYLYKQQKSKVLKLIGQAKEKQKNHLFFQCNFTENKYFIFLQAEDKPVRVSFAGQGQPSLKRMEEIHKDGLNNDLAEYLPVKDVKENTQRGWMDSGLGVRNKSHGRESGVQLKLKQNFIEYILRQNTKKLNL